LKIYINYDGKFATKTTGPHHGGYSHRNENGIQKNGQIVNKVHERQSELYEKSQRGTQKK
jgi:hypothetical protein